MAVTPDGLGAQGLSNQTSFLRPITAGTIHAIARRRHRGRTTWVWEVDISDDQDRVCALVRMTIAVRPLA
jgi:1,4-dihydroxy-2-naphthoyl-CoA hydrolase